MIPKPTKPTKLLVYDMMEKSFLEKLERENIEVDEELLKMFKEIASIHVNYIAFIVDEILRFNKETLTKALETYKNIRSQVESLEKTLANSKIPKNISGDIQYSLTLLWNKITSRINLLEHALKFDLEKEVEKSVNDIITYLKETNKIRKIKA